MLSKLLPVKISPKQHQLLKQIAHKQSTTMAAIIRRALDREIAALPRRHRLSELAHFAQRFPQETEAISDDEIIYDL